MKRLSLAALFIAPLFSVAAMAGNYTGPNANPAVTTAAAANEAADDTQVVLEGNIVHRIKGDNYQFRDATGTIVVEIDDKDWPALAVDEKQRLRLTGEVDRNWRDREVEVDRIEVIN